MLGSDVTTIKFSSKKYTSEQLRKVFGEASVIYLGAGEPEIFTGVLRDLKIYDLFVELVRNSDALVVGSSAGAALLSEAYIDLSKSASQIKPGWGILKGIKIVPHYDGSKIPDNFIPIKNSEFIEIRMDDTGCRVVHN